MKIKLVNSATMTIKWVALPLIFLIYSSALYANTVIPGKWQGKLNGTVDVAMNLIMDGSKLSGIVYTQFGESLVLAGEIKGQEFSFSTDLNGAQIAYKGKVVGDRMTINIASEWGDMKGELMRVDSATPLATFMRPEHTEFWEPVPPIIVPPAYSNTSGVPSDAIVLFDGKDLDLWQEVDGGKAKWGVSDSTFTVKKGTGDIQTKQSFEDYQLHIEWMIPADIEGEGQSRGNSGVFMQGIYELQILDSYSNETYVNGQAGSIYKQTPPLANAMRKPGEWNVYDILYTAPRFNDSGSLIYPARVTVLHNSIVIQNNVEIKGDTPYVGLPKYTPHGKGPIRLQDHGDPSQPISFRNIWIREL